MGHCAHGIWKGCGPLDPGLTTRAGAFEKQSTAAWASHWAMAGLNLKQMPWCQKGRLRPLQALSGATACWAARYSLAATGEAEGVLTWPIVSPPLGPPGPCHLPRAIACTCYKHSAKLNTPNGWHKLSVPWLPPRLCSPGSSSRAAVCTHGGQSAAEPSPLMVLWLCTGEVVGRTFSFIFRSFRATLSATRSMLAYRLLSTSSALTCTCADELDIAHPSIRTRHPFEDITACNCSPQGCQSGVLLYLLDVPSLCWGLAMHSSQGKHMMCVCPKGGPTTPFLMV